MEALSLQKSDPKAVVLDKIPCYTDVRVGQRVAAYWPGRPMFYPGKIKYKKSTGSNACYQKGVYDVLFDDGDRRMEEFNQIRLIPSWMARKREREREAVIRIGKIVVIRLGCTALLRGLVESQSMG